MTLCGWAGCGAVWLARVPWEHEVGGSNPPTPTRPTVVVVAQLVRAPDCGSGGRGFESPQPPQRRAVSARRLGRPCCVLDLPNEGTRYDCSGGRRGRGVVGRRSGLGVRRPRDRGGAEAAAGRCRACTGGRAADALRSGKLTASVAWRAPDERLPPGDVVAVCRRRETAARSTRPTAPSPTGSPAATK